MQNITIRETTRYVAATIGMFLVALGIALSIISNLGTSALSCPAYVANLKFPGISVGTFTWIINLVYLFVQLVILRKKFKMKYLLQIIASMMLGYMIDLNLWIFTFLKPDTFTARLAIMLISCIISAIGVSIELASEAWMLSAEMTAGVISKEYSLRFNRVKIVMDSAMVVITIIFSWIALGNPFGKGEFTSMADWLLARTPDIVIGIGTVMSAVCVGWIMKFTTPYIEKAIPPRDAARSWLRGKHL